MSRVSVAQIPAETTKFETGGTVLQKALDCFFLLRIPLLVPVWTILLLGWITGSGDLRLGGLLTNPAAIFDAPWLAIASFSLIVASIYVINQIVDIESDRINRKLFLLPHGFLSLRTAWTLAALCAASGLVLGACFIRNNAITALFLGSLALGALYNLPPVKLKNRAWGGAFANALGHGMLTFLVGWYVAKINQPFGAEILIAGLVSGFSPAFANAAVYLATTIPDAAGDRQTGKRTFCVVYGEKKTAIVSAILCAAALLSAPAMQHNWWIMGITSAASLLVFIMFAMSTKREDAFKAFKWPVFLLTAIVAIFVPVYGVLIILTFFGSKAYYKWRFGIDYPTLKSK